MPTEINWRTIRSWEGSQDRAFEELCYQLRDTAPQGWRTVKTGNPDGGVEWYYTSPAGIVHGYQCKFVWDIDGLIRSAKGSFETIASNLEYRDVRELTFIIPFDLSDQAQVNRIGNPVRSARLKWNEAVETWQDLLPPGSEMSVHLLTQGDLLERLLRAGNEGRLKFFFDWNVLSREWFSQKLEDSVALADERYTPEADVKLSIARDIDAVSLAPNFVADVELARRVARKSLQKLFASADAPAGPMGASVNTVSAAYETLKACPLVQMLENPLDPAGTSAELAEFDGLKAALSELADLIRPMTVPLVGALPGDGEQDSRAGGSTRTTHWEATLRTLQSAQKDVWSLERLLSDTAARAAETGSLLVTGEAGQGKTHLLVSSAKSMQTSGGLAICILGEQLDCGRDILTQVGEQLGLGAMPREELLGTLEAAAQTTDRRLLICIDALNESNDAHKWRTALISLLTSLRRYPDLAIVITCRTVFTDYILPSAQQLHRLGLVERVHPGFLGSELEAMEAYFAHLPSAWAKAPLIQPDFTNPLFLKLYAQGFEGLSVEETAEYDTHRSAVFARFIDSRIRRANARLEIDPSECRLERAIEAFASALADRGASSMPQEDAAALLNSFVPERTRWPDTALGVLSSEGVVAKRMSYQSGETRLEMGFPYQVLGDTQICAAVLERNRTTVETVRSGHVVLDDDSPLRRWIQAAPVNFQQAMVVLFPEATGSELIDSLAPNAAAIINEPSDDYAPESVDFVRSILSLMVETLPHRRPGSVTERTVELANLTLKYESWHLLWSSVFAVAAEPNHVLNADRLHARLLAMPRVERDAQWIPMTWNILDDDTSPLLRLLRWAERTRTPDNLLPAPNAVSRAQAESEVVRLAATALIWLLSSSNRFIRDRTTKALVQLLLGHGRVLLGLLKRFLVSDLERVDDGYLYERLLAVAYGWAMRVGSNQIAVTHELATFVVEHVLSADSPLAKHPNVLSRDHAQGIVALAITHGYAPAEDALIRPPFVSRLPANPPLEATLEERHPRKTEDATNSWSSLHSSIFSLGDFGKYEIESAVRYISKIRRTGSQPSTKGLEDSHRLVPSKWKKFLASLNPQQLEQLDQLLHPQQEGRLEQDDSTLDALAVLEILTDEQATLLANSWTTIRVRPKTIDGGWAKRWVFQEVVRLGWTPKRFNKTEENLFLGRGYDRGSHKAERIGKKYQWMALHELTARLLDNYYYGGHYGEGDYVGAWQLGLRDIDPSLPPAHFRPPSVFPGEDESRNSAVPTSGSTFADTQLSYFDAPARSLPMDDKAEEWVEGTADLPSLTSQLFRRDPSGRRWVALAEYVTHSDQSRTWEERYAEEWTHVYGWLTMASETERLADYLESRTLMGRWMPEGGERIGSYLGESGWALSWDDSENSGRQDDSAEAVYFGRDRGEAVPREPDQSGYMDRELFVHPATHGYLWESTTSDCSIEQSVNVIIPANVLLEMDQLRRHPDKPEWFIGPTSVAVHVDYASSRLRGSALLVDEEWLASRLRDLGYGLVFGLLGERRRTGTGGVWREIDHIAHFDGTRWKFGAVRSTVKSPAEE